MAHSILPIVDPIVIFALVASLILVVPFGAKKLRVPPLVGLLLTGAILGPNAFHVLERDQSFILLGKVGLMFLMFIAALEVDLGIFKKLGVQAAIFGVITVALPLTISVPIALYVLHYDPLPGFLLASIFSSHTLLAYPIASSMGISKTRAVITAVGATMIADTTALLILAVIVGIHVQGHITETFWWRLAISLSIYGCAVFLGLPRLCRWVFRKVGKDGNVQFTFILAAFFVCAATAHLAGLEPIVGAFLAGLALNRFIPHNGTLMNRIVFAGETIFIPFFLISVGMILDARVLFDGVDTWILIVYLTGLVLLTKYMASQTTRLLFRFNRAESFVIFSLTLSQAAATLALAEIGFNVGLLGEPVVNASIVMILVTCTISPIVMERFGRQVAEQAAKAAAAEHVGPRQRVLVGLRELASAQAVIELSLLLRDASQHQPLYLVHAARDDESVGDNVGRAEKMLSDAVTLCSSADVAAEISTSIDHTVGAALVRSTKETQATHLVLGWNFETPAGEQSAYGSTVDELLRASTSAILLFRSRHPVSTTQKITLALPPLTFPDDVLTAAITAVKRIAQQLGAPIEVLTEAKTWERYAGIIGDAKPEAATKHHPLETWDSLRQALVDRTSTSDLLVLVGHRESNRDIARTTLGLAERFPEASIALIHGPVAATRSEEASQPALSLVADAT